MKMRHDYDATLLSKPIKAKLTGAALALLVVAGSASMAAPVQNSGKMLHDCCAWGKSVNK